MTTMEMFRRGRLDPASAVSFCIMSSLGVLVAGLVLTEAAELLTGAPHLKIAQAIAALYAVWGCVCVRRCFRWKRPRPPGNDPMVWPPVDPRPVLTPNLPPDHYSRPPARTRILVDAE